MADTKITEMVAGTLSADDLFTFVDDPTGTPVNKKIAYSTIESGLSITESQISDLGTYATTAYVDAAVVGLYDHKGAYNASTNSPDLDTSPSGVLKGDAYTVSVAGTFFTVAVDAGDVLIADQDSPTLESHWTIINRNIDETAFATASHTHTASDVTDFSEAVDDRVGALVVGGTDITVTYDDGAGTLTVDSTASGGSTLPVVDTTGIAKGSVDATKIVRLEVDGLTTATTRVLTVQDADGTIALTGHSHAASDITSGTLPHERGGLEADVSGYAGVPLIDSGTTSEIKYNLTATTDPGVGDDSVDGYTIGSRWVNVTLDKEFVCLDASTGAAVWSETTAAAGVGSGGDIGVNAGNPSGWFMSPMPRQASLSTYGQPADYLMAMPVYLPAATWTEIGLIVTSGGGNARMALYESANGKPGALVVDGGVVDVSSIGRKQWTISESLSEGWYWVAMLADTHVTVKSVLGTGGALGILGYTDPDGSSINIYSALTNSHAYGAMPNPWPSDANVWIEGGSPLLWAKQ